MKLPTPAVSGLRRADGLSARRDRAAGGGFGRVRDAILGLTGSVWHVLGHDRDGRPDARGGHDGRLWRIWPTLL